MSDSLEPPAKRARLEADAPIYGAASATTLDAPGSPVDDMDDDFYDTTPVKPAALPVEPGTTSSFAAAAPVPAPFHLPGLGSLSETPAAQATPAVQQPSAISQPEPPEDGELSDEEAFYDDANADADAQAHAHVPVQPPPAANEGQARDEAPQHDAVAVAAADTPTADTDGELDAALTAAIDLQNELEDAANGAAFDSKAEFLRAAAANQGDDNAEWQLDSDASDSESSSSSSSADSSDDEGSDEGELLDPEQQVRFLMAEAADEPGIPGPVKVKTLNEVEEKYEKPDITVTEDTKITELGKVESIVENLVVVKANTSGDEQVLESGSALCLQNRRVEEPRYSFGFNDAAELATLGIEKDTPVYYVNEYSTLVETEPIRRQKHTDASNLHDEETNDVEFSDDEKEAEYKREQKAKKRARADSTDEQPAVHIPTGPRLHVDAPPPPIYRSMEYQGGGLKYSDDEDEDLGMYKPLARPDHFEQIVGQGAPLEDRSHVRRGMGRGRGPWGDRGRGFRGRGGGGDRGAGGRGDFGGGRGDRGGHRGDRGGHGNNRGDRNGGDRGGRGGKNQSDRGRQQDHHQRNGPYQDNRSATSASPARQPDRGQSQQSQSHQSPPGGGKNKNRKQRQREKREKERQQQQEQHQQQQKQRQQHASPTPSAPSAGWPVPFSGPSQPAVPYAAPVPPPPPPAAAYAPPPPSYTPQPQAPALPQQQPQQQQQAANWAAWAQWFQVVGAMSGQQPPQPQMPAPAPAPPPPQPQPQYAYPYQQYAQNPTPPPNHQPQGNAQPGTPSLQDILRALGGGGAPQ
ncbi:NAF1-domain-containing protein [Decorospora gaudefroyi]|uniref:NAF1-domain-containing protein n=1 Tax=Decorospora gaudefroyi TaxID=184978 RepID=A0A6A5K430_9PLEO|nr:NAF1-domain-containing protein [Decorospora gaudefroyi]